MCKGTKLEATPWVCVKVGTESLFYNIIQHLEIIL